MSIKELISAISLKHQQEGIKINPPASADEIMKFENKIGFELPNDFKEFYSICNGFECEEDIFNFIPLDEITRLSEIGGKDWFCFSEYMIYTGTWSVRVNNEFEYEIFNDIPNNIVLTHSFKEFLEIFLQGGVFDDDGLYKWQQSKGFKKEELKEETQLVKTGIIRKILRKFKFYRSK